MITHFAAKAEGKPMLNLLDDYTFVYPVGVTGPALSYRMSDDKASLGELFVALADLLWDDSDEDRMWVSNGDLKRIATRFNLMAEAADYNAAEEM